MAKLIRVEPPAERVFTIQLTEREIGTIIAAIGASHHHGREVIAQEADIPILEYPQQYGRLRTELERMLMSKGDKVR